MTYPDEIECRQCDGYGWTSRREPTNILGDCEPCNGTGWRAPTDDERDKIEWELNQ